MDQPPSGGCVLKRFGAVNDKYHIGQPPSGGCVLKRDPAIKFQSLKVPAAFGRLCVETLLQPNSSFTASQPPLGGCVLKHRLGAAEVFGFAQPPSGGCVLKQ